MKNKRRNKHDRRKEKTNQRNRCKFAADVKRKPYSHEECSRRVENQRFHGKESGVRNHVDF